MQIHKNKTAVILAIFLILSMTTSSVLLTLPTANAHTPPWNNPTLSHINVAPNPAGVGQEVTVGFWLDQPPPTAGGPYGDRWQNITVKVTMPDGTTTILGPFASDDTGGTYTTFTPTKGGNYTFQMSFPGQTLAGKNPNPSQSALATSFVGDYFEPSSSNIVTLTVQQTPISSIPQVPLPTSYWTRPIESVNGLWYSISGNWLGFGRFQSSNTGMYNATGNFNPYTTAPTTAHILWTKPELFGGLVGGEFGGTEQSNYYSTSQYEPKFAPIIMNGILYYVDYPGSSSNPAGWVALDLQTGQTVWTEDTPLALPAATYSLGNGTTLSVANGNYNTVSTQGTCTILRCGQILDYVSPNQYGSLAYLWSTGTPAMVASATNIAPGTTTWNMFDAMTGSYILSIVNGSAIMQLTEDDQGNLIGYYTSGGYLNCWNSSKCIPIAAAGWQWRPPQGAIIPFNAGIKWSVPLPTNLTGVPLPTGLTLDDTFSPDSLNINSGVVCLTARAPYTAGAYQTGFQIEAGYDVNTGAQLWITNRTETPFTKINYNPPSNGIYAEICQNTGVINGYSVTTGKQLWGPITLSNPNPYNSIGQYSAQVANGIDYISSFGGDIYALNYSTGAIIWQTDTTKLSGDAESDTPYGVWTLWLNGNPGIIADGILFLAEGHEYAPPLFRGASQLAINLTDGHLVWSIMAFDTTGPALSDGIMTVLNAYDNQIYAYGQGPSKTTVIAPDTVATVGVPLVITGRVTDLSAGASQSAVAANFPNGLPCVSDGSMSHWMEYVYMQQVYPQGTTGVPVTISVIDSNNNFRTIGKMTSDASGAYSLNWAPDIPGNYTVIATFAGSGGYYSSSAETAIYAVLPVTSAPTTSPITNLATTGDLMTYIIASAIAIIIVIAIVGVLTVMMLRKRA